MIDWRDRGGRRSNRHPSHDYSRPATYFVTICTAGRQPVLAVLRDGVSHLTPIGKIVASCWWAIPRHFPSVRLDRCMIMPDHLHGIIDLRSPRDPGRSQPSLGLVIRLFKAASTTRAKHAALVHTSSLWQRGFHDRVVRNPEALSRIRTYILRNPRKR